MGEDDLIVDFLKILRVNPLVAMSVALPFSGFERRHWLDAQLFGWHCRFARTTAAVGPLRVPVPRCGPRGLQLPFWACVCASGATTTFGPITAEAATDAWKAVTIADAEGGHFLMMIQRHRANMLTIAIWRDALAGVSLAQSNTSIGWPLTSRGSEGE